MGKLSAFGYSCIGRREENEDSYSLSVENGRVTAVVADGLGGHGGGGQASEIAVCCLKECDGRRELPDGEEILRRFRNANDEIVQRRKNQMEMKTTAVYLCVKDKEAIWAHIGDSRLYHFYEGRLADYTRDHSVSQLAVDLGEISRDEIRNHRERSRVLRVLGSEDMQPDIHPRLELAPGFHGFLLCTDGFWEYVLDEEMLMDLQKAVCAEEWISSMQLRLGRRVQEGNDNHTAVAVMMEI